MANLFLEHLKELVEKEGVATAVDQHWPSIIRHLRDAGFLGSATGYTSQDIMAACHLACEQLIESML